MPSEVMSDITPGPVTPERGEGALGLGGHVKRAGVGRSAHKSRAKEACRA